MATRQNLQAYILGFLYLAVQSTLLYHYDFRAWWFEPWAATISFGTFINIYWYFERCRGLSSDTALFSTWSLSLGPVFNSFFAYWIGVYIWMTVIPPAAKEIPDGFPSNWTVDLLYLVAEVVSGVFLYDFVFFWIHWAFHAVPFLRRFHQAHHHNYSVRKEGERHQVLESRDTLRHGLLDGSLQVLVNILVQRHTCWGSVKTRLARLLHNVVVTWMLTEAHTSSPHPYIWRRWCIGIREHRFHHLNEHRCYEPAGCEIAQVRFHRFQQFFGYLDNTRSTWLHWRQSQSQKKNF